MATYNNYGSGGAGSYNFGRKKREAQYGSGAVNYGNNYGHMYGRKKREAQTYINHGSGGSGSTNYNYGTSYNNFGSGGAGSSNSNHYSGTINYGTNFGRMHGRKKREAQYGSGAQSRRQWKCFPSSSMDNFGNVEKAWHCRWVKT